MITLTDLAYMRTGTLLKADYIDLTVLVTQVSNYSDQRNLMRIYVLYSDRDTVFNTNGTYNANFFRDFTVIV